MNVTLGRALKIKNRLAQRIGEVVKRIGRGIKSQSISQEEYEAWLKDPESVQLRYDWDFKNEFSKLQAFQQAITSVKSAIHVGNAESDQTMRTIRLAELKGIQSLIAGLDCTVDEEWTRKITRMTEADESKRYEIPAMTLQEQALQKAHYQRMIENLQDEIDHFNATTEIDIDENIVDMLDG